MQFMDTIWEKVFPTPRICPFCRKKQEYLNICQNCMEKIKALPNELGICQRCGTFGKSQQSCTNCSDWPQYFIKNIAVAPYVGVYKDILWKYKFHNQRWLAPVLANIMFQKLREEKNIYDYIIPVPLHKKKKRQRGFNQAEILARKMTVFLGLNYSHNLLLRIKDTPRQTNLNRAKRQRNMQDAFCIKNASNLKGKKILLVDDVLTTGITLRECAKVLYKQGAKEISGITWTAGLNKEV